MLLGIALWHLGKIVFKRHPLCDLVLLFSGCLAWQGVRLSNFALVSYHLFTPIRSGDFIDAGGQMGNRESYRGFPYLPQGHLIIVDYSCQTFSNERIPS